jgi:hypothetical protein
MPSQTKRETITTTVTRAANGRFAPKRIANRLATTRNERRRTENMEAMNTPVTSDYENTAIRKAPKRTSNGQGHVDTSSLWPSEFQVGVVVGGLATAALIFLGMILKAVMDVQAV